MTPRSMTELLLQQMKVEVDYFDFRREAPLMLLLPPKVVMAAHIATPQHEASNLKNFQVLLFSDFKEITELGANAIPLRGTPYNVGKFLNTPNAEVLFDFSPLGYVFLSPDKKIKSHQLKSHPALYHWLDYALSPELWGPQGKWIRFHQRLNTLFANNHLLRGKAYPGFYPVSASGADWKKLSIQGDLVGDILELTIPWSFPLSALENLERQLMQEK